MPSRFNLDSSVGRVRVGRWRRGRVGATTLQANACEAEQRPRARCQWLNRACSVATHMVNRVEARKVNVHNDLLMKTSGQLRNLGLLQAIAEDPSVLQKTWF